MDKERMKQLFENMAQYIFERLTCANLSEAEIKNVFTENIGFTESEYADEIGDFSRPKE